MLRAYSTTTPIKTCASSELQLHIWIKGTAKAVIGHLFLLPVAVVDSEDSIRKLKRDSTVIHLANNEPSPQHRLRGTAIVLLQHSSVLLISSLLLDYLVRKEKTFGFLFLCVNKVLLEEQYKKFQNL